MELHLFYDPKYQYLKYEMYSLEENLELAELKEFCTEVKKNFDNYHFFIFNLFFSQTMKRFNKYVRKRTPPYQRLLSSIRLNYLSNLYL